MTSKNPVALGLAAAALLVARPALPAPPVTETEEVVYVVNSYVHGAPAPDWSTFTMLRGTTLAPLGTLALGRAAHTVAITPDGERAWVTVTGANRISLVDTTTFTVLSEIDPGPVGPEGVAVSPGGLSAWVTYSETGQVGIFNARTGALIDVLDIGGRPDFILFTPDGSKAYVVDYQTPQVVAIRTEGPDGDVVATLPFSGHALQDAVVSPDGRRVYVANRDEHQVEVIDTATDAALDPIPTDLRPRGLGLSPDGRYLFVGHWNPAGLPAPGNGLSMIRLADGVVVSSISAIGNFRRIAVRADGSRLFVVDHDGDFTFAVDVAGETLRVARSENLDSVSGFMASPVGVAPGRYRTPVPRITINGSDGPVRLTRAGTARLALALDSNGRSDQADWWLACATPTGTFYWTSASGWTRTVQPATQGRLATTSSALPDTPLAGWTPGTYVFGFAVDVKRDAVLSTRFAYSDSVTMVLGE